MTISPGIRIISGARFLAWAVLLGPVLSAAEPGDRPDKLERAREMLWETMADEARDEESKEEEIEPEEVSAAEGGPARAMSPRHAARVRSRNTPRAAMSRARGGLEKGTGLVLPPRQVPMRKFRRRGEEFDPYDWSEVTRERPVRLSAELLQPSLEPFMIGPGDVLDIEVPGVAGTRATTLVGPDGRIYYYLLPGLDVWGMTLGEAKELIERQLMSYLNQVPNVTLTVKSVGSKRVWLLGRLQSPGLYPMTEPITLLEAIANAGGALTSGDTELASLEDSFVIREGQILPVDFQRLLRRGDTSQNIVLHPDDFVYLPSAHEQQVYVLGAVRRAIPLPYQGQMTLVTAVTSAGGPAGGARLSQVAIVRGSLTEPSIAVVDFREIMKGRAPDILLEPRDIVYVPRSPYQFLGRYLSMILNTFVRTVAISEGVRAVDTEQDVTIGLNPENP